MSVEDSGDWTNPNATDCGFVRSALILAGSLLAVAAPLCLLSIMTGQTGSGNCWGVATAGAICLLSGWAADVAGTFWQRAGSPLGALLTGIAVRSFLPLAACLKLALDGGGREHLAFVVYLLSFYGVALSLDTWWAVQRAAAAGSKLDNRVS